MYKRSINITDFNDSLVLCYQFIKEDSIVLDVGCAYGDFGVLLKKEKNCKIYGFEQNAESIKVAQETRSYIAVHQVDLEKESDLLFPEYDLFFDYIICADVLEHLRNPEIVLLHLKKFLKPNGFFIISIPNISHASIKIKLLNDNFSYTDVGLLDKTHLRFFTHKTIPELLAKENLVINDVSFTYASIKEGSQAEFLKLLETPILKSILSSDHSYVFQYILKVCVDENLTFAECKHNNQIINNLDSAKLLEAKKSAKKEIKNTRQNIFKYKLYNLLNCLFPSRFQTKVNKYTRIIEHGNEINHRQASERYNFLARYEEDIDFSAYSTELKTIAYYLPQFHTFYENDQWWGKGFTEWTKTRPARSRFDGHYQPREPHFDIGYYDLTDVMIMKNQWELAKRHNIYGFCIYYYWFSGKKLMERPINNLLEHPEIDFPFMLCWANENWTRRWDGGDKEILIAQKYSENDPIAFIKDISPYLKDHRYIKINNKPIIVVYKVAQIPNHTRVFQLWRKWCKENGIGDIEIWAVRTGDYNSVPEVDKEVEFPPHPCSRFHIDAVFTQGKREKLVSYKDLAKNAMHPETENLLEKNINKVYRAVTLGWDNSPRRTNVTATIFDNFSLTQYHEWLKNIAVYTRRNFKENERFIFINAWNEWAEGTYLEPDKRFGYAFINTTSRAINNLNFNSDV